MARTTQETADILSELYDETFANDSCEPFRIDWSSLRGIAGVAKLNDWYLRGVNQALNETGYTLVPFDNSLVVVKEIDMINFRLTPPRIVEKYLYDEEEEQAHDDENVDPDFSELNDVDVDKAE